MKEALKCKASPGMFLLVKERYIGRRRKAEFETLDAAHEAASRFWMSDRISSSSKSGPMYAEVYDDQGRRCPPSSYIDMKRPPINDALLLECALHSDMTFDMAFKVLTNKGYFTPPPRPWSLGRSDRGMGHGSYGVLDKFGVLIIGELKREFAEFIVAAANAYTPPPAPETDPQEALSS